MAADPPRPSNGADFVTSGARAPRKPKIEVLEPGSTAAPSGGVAASHREEPLVDSPESREPLGSRKAERPPELMRGEPSARMRAPATEASKRPEPTARHGNGFQFTPRVMFLGLLALAVLAALYGFFAVERGQDADSAGTEAAVREASPVFPEDTGPYYEPEASEEAQRAAAAEAREQEQLASADTETAAAQAPGMRVELPSTAPQRVERQPAPATPRPRAEPRPEPRRTAPAAPSEEREEEASAPVGSTGALQTVGAFYAALGDGDGASAASLVVPSKRRSGPLSAGELTRYFSSFRRPLRIRRATALDEDTVRVAYDYVLPDGRECRGQALVDVVQRGDRARISRIRTRGPC